MKLRRFVATVDGRQVTFANGKAYRRFMADRSREEYRLNAGITDKGETPSGYVRVGQGGGKVKPKPKPACEQRFDGRKADERAGRLVKIPQRVIIKETLHGKETIIIPATYVLREGVSPSFTTERQAWKERRHNVEEQARVQAAKRREG